MFYSHHLQAFPALLHTPPSTALAGRACSTCQGVARKTSGGRPVRTMTRASTTASVRRCRRPLGGPSWSATRNAPSKQQQAQAQLRHPYLPFAGQPPHGGTCEYTQVILYYPYACHLCYKAYGESQMNKWHSPQESQSLQTLRLGKGLQPHCRGAQEHDFELKSAFSGEVDAESVFVSR